VHAAIGSPARLVTREGYWVCNPHDWSAPSPPGTLVG
jgi:hypothetical protein